MLAWRPSPPSLPGPIQLFEHGHRSDTSSGDSNNSQYWSLSPNNASTPESSVVSSQDHSDAPQSDPATVTRQTSHMSTPLQTGASMWDGIRDEAWYDQDTGMTHLPPRPMSPEPQGQPEIVPHSDPASNQDKQGTQTPDEYDENGNGVFWSPVDDRRLGAKETYTRTPVRDTNDPSAPTANAPFRKSSKTMPISNHEIFSRTRSALSSSYNHARSALSSWWSTYGLSGTAASTNTARLASIAASWTGCTSSDKVRYGTIAGFTALSGLVGGLGTHDVMSRAMSDTSLVGSWLGGYRQYVTDTTTWAAAGVVGVGAAAMGGMAAKWWCGPSKEAGSETAEGEEGGVHDGRTGDSDRSGAPEASHGGGAE